MLRHAFAELLIAGVSVQADKRGLLEVHTKGDRRGNKFGIRVGVQANLGQRPNGAISKFGLGLLAHRLQALDVPDAVMLRILPYEPNLELIRPD